MTAHSYRYSMVVDWPWTHPYQAEILLFTLQEFAGVPREAIVVQCTDRVGEEVTATFRQNGYTVVDIEPYLDRIYCNKIAQLDHLAERLPPDCAGVFLLDLDLAILAPLGVADPAVVWGKIVDGDNPPLAVLERVFAQAGVPLPAIVPSDWTDRGKTIATNFNGGFLYVPQTRLKPLRAAWRKWAEFLFARQHWLPADCRKHIDQISFALAMASERIPHQHLSTNWNFPCHEQHPLRFFREDEPLRALHYHDCLDDFGLIAPRGADYPAVDAATEQVNAAIGRRRATPFFDLFKRQLAKQAIRQVPVVPGPLFSAEFIARTWIGATKRRLILHAGTPKTGTSSLQRVLADNRQELAEEGWWYPPPSEPDDPKHQAVNNLLRGGDERAFVAYLEDALRTMPDNTHTVLLSTEGIFNHWWDYGQRSKGLLRQLAALFDFELCVWFRPPAHFLAALYVQYVANPKTTDTPRNVHGQDIEFGTAMDDPWFRRHVDYLGFCLEARLLFGRNRVRTFLFGGDTVQTFIDHYGLPLAADRRWSNTSLRRAGVEMLRIANRFPLDGEDQREVVDLVRQIDGIIGAKSTRFGLNENEGNRVARYAQRGWHALQSLHAQQPAGDFRRQRQRPRDKVFCIGFHKTGTKSLGEALRMLGYRVTGPNGTREQDIGTQALAMALASATEFDAFNDMPWPILYKELDAVFPGSKFILTVRATNQWIDSVVGHFGGEETPMREWVYRVGAPLGNEDRYMARYEQHIKEVREYFRDREDLLEMNIEEGDGWTKLGEFLRLPTPDAPFPHENRRGRTD